MNENYMVGITEKDLKNIEKFLSKIVFTNEFSNKSNNLKKLELECKNLVFTYQDNVYFHNIPEIALSFTIPYTDFSIRNQFKVGIEAYNEILNIITKIGVYNKYKEKEFDFDAPLCNYKHIPCNGFVHLRYSGIYSETPNRTMRDIITNEIFRHPNIIYNINNEKDQYLKEQAIKTVREFNSVIQYKELENAYINFFVDVISVLKKKNKFHEGNKINFVVNSNQFEFAFISHVLLPNGNVKTGIITYNSLKEGGAI